MDEKQKLPLGEAQAAIDPVFQELRRACEDGMICGSIRRKKEHVGDAEIVVLPVYERDLYGNPGRGYPALDAAIKRLADKGLMRLDHLLSRNGPKYKRFRLLNAPLALDLFIADAGNFGNLCAIRTGDAEFSQAMVTSRDRGGIMPRGYSQRDGHLWRGEEQIECRTEDTFFQTLGITQTPLPQGRTGLLARALARKLSEEYVTL